MSRPMFRRWIGYPLETAIGFAAFGMFSVLPTSWASAVGGWLGRTIGPRVGASRRARQNLRLVYPDWDETRREEIVRGMWDNLGRTFAEYAHLGRLRRAMGPTPDHRVQVVGAEKLDPAASMILFSGHIGNWELCVQTAHHLGLDVAFAYRAPNNPSFDWLVRRLRRLPEDRLVPKGSDGARNALAVLQSGGSIGFLADQKMNDGIRAPFLGRDAMTAPAMANLALRFDVPLIPAWVERLDGSRFRVTVDDPIDLPKSGDRHRDAAEITERVNDIIGEWIRARPEQWLWLHRRFPDADYASLDRGGAISGASSAAATAEAGRAVPDKD